VAEASDSDGSIFKVEFFRDGASTPAATVMTFPYSATLNGIPAGNHTITARATDDRGGTTTTPAVAISVAATSITITSPAPNATIAGANVLVQGRIQALSNTGVFVNNQPATLDAFGNFYVNLPLNAGPNTIVASLNTVDGAVLTSSISVTATGVPSPYLVAANPSVGFAPLAVTLTITNPTSGDVSVTSELTGPFLLPAGSAGQLTFTLPAGVFTFTFVFTDAGGHTFTNPVLLEARDRAQMDQMFRAIWDGLNRALVAGDKEGAMRYLNGGAKRKFGPVFDALLPFMPEIVASYSPLQQSSLTNGIAEYAVIRSDGSKKRIYLIYFTQDADGVWRIDEM
jgi:hypothetical protein